jgi:hypothetical protein
MSENIWSLINSNFDIKYLIYKEIARQRTEKLRKLKSSLNEVSCVFNTRKIKCSIYQQILTLVYYYPSLINMDNDYFILNRNNASNFILNYYIGQKQNFNLDFDNCNNLINLHIPPNYRLKSSIIGRSFTKYDKDSILSVIDPKLYFHLNKTNEIDLFINVTSDKITKESSRYVKNVKKTFRNIHSWYLKNLKSNCEKFKCMTYAIDIDNKTFYIRKIKYLHKKLYFNVIICDISVYNYLNTFSYDFDRICFMYSTKNIYIHCGLTTHSCSKLYKATTTLDLTSLNYLMSLTFQELKQYTQPNDKSFYTTEYDQISSEYRKLMFFAKGFDNRLININYVLDNHQKLIRLVYSIIFKKYKYGWDF